MDELPTVRSAMDAGCRVAVICLDCGHDRDLDLVELSAWGYGPTALLALPLLCKCGSRRHRIVVSGVAPGYG